MEKLQDVKIIIPQFITHAPTRENKTKESPHIKLNSQLIYNSNLNRFARNNVVNFLHKYIAKYIPKGLKITQFPIQIGLNFYVPKNYGSVSRRKLKSDNQYHILWKKPEEDYEINWDIGNYGYIWLKTFLDTLQIEGVIPDDNAGYVSAEGPARFIQVDTFEERRLEFIIKIK